MINDIVQISVPITNPSVGISKGVATAIRFFRPVPLHVRMGELLVLCSELVGRESPGPVLPLLAWIQRLSRDPLSEVILRPRHVRLDIVREDSDILVADIDLEGEVQELLHAHIRLARYIRRLPAGRVHVYRAVPHEVVGVLDCVLETRKDSHPRPPGRMMRLADSVSNRNMIPSWVRTVARNL